MAAHLTREVRHGVVREVVFIFLSVESVLDCVIFIRFGACSRNKPARKAICPDIPVSQIRAFWRVPNYDVVSIDLP